jgi:hypothetical protein
VVDCEPLIVLMPSDHRLASREAIHPREFVGEIFIGGSEKATVLGAVTQDYLNRSGLNIQLDTHVPESTFFPRVFRWGPTFRTLWVPDWVPRFVECPQSFIGPVGPKRGTRRSGAR